MNDVADKESGVEVKKTFCWPSPGCHCNCGLLVRVKNNKILSIKGNPVFPYNRGTVCAERMPHFREWLDHPDQLMVPLKRQGGRGENRWERISWEQALDEIAEKLQTIKAEHGAGPLDGVHGPEDAADEVLVVRDFFKFQKRVFKLSQKLESLLPEHVSLSFRVPVHGVLPM